MATSDQEIEIPRPRVLILDLSKNYGGSISRILGLIKNSPEQDMAIAGLHNSALSQMALRDRLPYFELGAHKADPLILLRLIKLIRSAGFQILDTQNIQSKFWGSLASLLVDITLVSTINSWYSDEHGKLSIKGKIYTLAELATNWKLDLYITVSKKDKKSLIRANIPEDRISLIYNAVDPKTEKILGNSAWLKKKFLLPNTAIVCTAVGRLVHIKGYDVLIEAVRYTGLDASQMVFLIVGEGETREELETQIKKLKLQRSIYLAGYQRHETVLSILKSSDMFVMPSRYEGTPIALLEAAALGLPIVASASGGIPELVKNEEHAFLVPPDNPVELAEKIRSLFVNRELARTLGNNARNRIQTCFSLDKQVLQTKNAYQLAYSNHCNKQHRKIHRLTLIHQRNGGTCTIQANPQNFYGYLLRSG